MNIHKKYNKSSCKQRRARTSGVVIVETAMVFVFVVLPLTLAIVQFGIFYGANNALTHLARDGARFAAVYAIANNNPTTLDVDEGDDSYIIERIKQQANKSILGDLDRANISISPVPRGTRSQYSMVTITITYDLNKKSFMPFNLGLFKPGVQVRKAQAMIE